MPNNSRLQLQIAQKVGICIVLGVIVWIVLLIIGAGHVRTATDTNSYDVAIGPFALNHIEKSVVEGGYKVSISFEPGLLWYLLACCGLGVVLGCGVARWQTKIKRHRTNPRY
jgi:hypothetical protein